MNNFNEGGGGSGSEIHSIGYVIGVEIHVKYINISVRALSNE